MEAFGINALRVGFDDLGNPAFLEFFLRASFEHVDEI